MHQARLFVNLLFDVLFVLLFISLFLCACNHLLIHPFNAEMFDCLTGGFIHSCTCCVHICSDGTCFQGVVDPEDQDL